MVNNLALKPPGNGLWWGGGMYLCSRGGIGRHAGLRSLWGNPSRFKSAREHQFSSVNLFNLYTHTPIHCAREF